MMDTFFIIQYELSTTPLINTPQYYPLSYIKLTKLNLTNSQQQQQQQTLKFLNLDTDLTQKKILFNKMLKQITQMINQSMLNFVNVTLVSQEIKIFTEILPMQCQRRDINLPFVMMNYIDIKQIVRREYQCTYKRLQEIVQYLELYTVKEQAIKNKTTTQLLSKIIIKLYQQHKLQSTTMRYEKRCKKLSITTNSPSQSLISHQHQYNKQSSKHYKVIGIPFKSFPSQILQLLAPQVPKQQKDIVFIYQKQRFSGRAVIKIPQDYQQLLIKKNRMYIGNRYIELQKVSQEEFQKMKIRQERRKQQQTRGGNNNSIDRDRDRRQINSYSNNINTNNNSYQNTSNINRRRNDETNDRDNEYNIGGRRQPQKHSSQRRSRSRQRQHNYRDNKPQRHNNNQYNKQHHNNNNTDDQFGIKIRGLPFAFTQWDVQNIFGTNYNIIGGSVKLGIKAGTMMKNGQAVMLMRYQQDARRAIDMNGYRVMGRYLQVRVITKDQYMRYK